MYDYFLNEITFKNLIISSWFLIDLMYNKPFCILDTKLHKLINSILYDNYYLQYLVQNEINIFSIFKVTNNNFTLEVIWFFSYYNSYHFFLIYKIILFIFLFLYCSILLINAYNSENDKNIFYKKFCNYLIIFLRFLFEKLENIEESYGSLKLIAFILSLIFSNIFFWNNYINFIVFIEWNLPVCFGIILVLELFYLLGSYMFIYLNGANSRKIIIASFFEDLINFFILLVRVFLQFIRGVICGIYHDLLRESNIVTIRWLIDLDDNLFLNESNDLNLTSIYLLNIFLFYLFYLFIITFGVTLVFLQSIFLCLAIWLFCKCWFLSIYESKFFIKNNIKYDIINK